MQEAKACKVFLLSFLSTKGLGESPRKLANSRAFRSSDPCPAILRWLCWEAATSFWRPRARCRPSKQWFHRWTVDLGPWTMRVTQTWHRLWALRAWSTHCWECPGHTATQAWTKIAPHGDLNLPEQLQHLLQGMVIYLTYMPIPVELGSQHRIICCWTWSQHHMPQIYAASSTAVAANALDCRGSW